jgi:allophanate hydrolase subunit 2
LHCVVAADAIRELTLAPGEELDGEVLRQRAYGYIAVSRGFEVPLVMGGRGTCLPGGFGGFEGRELRQGDRLVVGEAASGPGRPAKRRPGPVASPGPGVGDLDPGPAVVRILPGDRRVGNSTSFHALLDVEWRAGAGNRVGLRLDGPELRVRPMPLSQPIPPGAVQVTGAGQPIILLRDHPTVGGYPVVAVVAAADLDVCAQLRLGDNVRFVRL